MSPLPSPLYFAGNTFELSLPELASLAHPPQGQSGVEGILGAILKLEKGVENGVEEDLSNLKEA